MKNFVLSKVIIAIIVAAVVGRLVGEDSAIFGVLWIHIFDLIGQLFLNALTLVVVPLVTASIITGAARLGEEKQFGKLGSRTVFFFVLTTLAAVLIGVLVAVFVAPGSDTDSSALQRFKIPESLQDLAQEKSGVFDRIQHMFYQLIPKNILFVASQGQMLGIIFFALLFGFFSSRIDPALSKTITSFWKGTFQIMMKITQLIMQALPVGVFGLMAKVFATTGYETIKSVSVFFACVIASLLLFMFGFLPLLLIVFRVNVFSHFKAAAPALITAFSTSSTAATLPITIECMEERANIPNRISSFVLPLGTTLNLAGSALFAATAVIFISQLSGLPLNVANLTTIILMSLFAGLGMVAGIPSASIITIMIILKTLDLPPDGIALVLIVERLLDMCRTAASVLSNTCCAKLVHQMDR